jgi:hypothetical protein
MNNGKTYGFQTVTQKLSIDLRKKLEENRTGGLYSSSFVEMIC